MEKQLEEFKLRPFANMLDAGSATATAYHVPRNAAFWLVVVDGEGKIAFNAGRGWHYSDGPNKGKLVHHHQIERGAAKFPGILGLKDVPPGMETTAHYFDLQQFDLLEGDLRKAEAKSSLPSAKDFAAKVRARVAEFRTARAEQVQKLAEGEPLQAYRDAEAFVQAFPAAPEKAAVAQMARDLAQQPAVKKELQAEAAYRRILVPEMVKAKDYKAFQQRIKPLLEGYVKTYADTQYAAVAKDAVDAHGKALAKAP